MPIKRFDELTAPPIPGRYYWVWCVKGTWYGEVKDWPTWGPKHEDAKFFNFIEPHYHLNRHFLSKYDQHKAVSAPLHRDLSATSALRRRKCLTDTPEPFPALTPIHDAYAGSQCARGVGWICPHKGMDLGPVAVGEDGVIACPLHGLRIDATTGVVVGRKAA